MDIAKALGALDDQDRKVLIDGLREWSKEARYTESDVGVFGSDKLGDALDALAEFVAPTQVAQLDQRLRYRTQLEQNRTWSVYEGLAYRKGGFRLEADAVDWIKRTIREEVEATR